jgi:methyltransferase
MVEIGMDEPVQISEVIPPKTRVTLQIPENDDQQVEPIHPKAPREEAGYYWGFEIRKCASLSAVFTDSPFEDGYDISIGTSERGMPLSKAFPPTSKPAEFKHLIVVFGGPRGLEYASMNDPELSGMNVSGGRTKELFDHWINVLPNQGSRTIRTDEAVFIALSGLRRLWDSE